MVWALAWAALVALVTCLAWRRLAAVPAPGGRVRTMIVLGSGGHTAEMLKLLPKFNLHIYRPRSYVVAATDRLSADKARALEALIAQSEVADDGQAAAASSQDSKQVRAPRRAMHPKLPLDAPPSPSPAFDVRVIPRSREVGQGIASSALSSARALVATIPMVLRARPDLVRRQGLLDRRRMAKLVVLSFIPPRNLAGSGQRPWHLRPDLPGGALDQVRQRETSFRRSTGARVRARSRDALFALLPRRVLGLGRGRIVYVESIARVTRLSLTGKILYHCRLASLFFVQVRDAMRSGAGRTWARAAVASRPSSPRARRSGTSCWSGIPAPRTRVASCERCRPPRQPSQVAVL